MRIERSQLSTWHEALLAEHAQGWARMRLSTLPADRESAEKGAFLAYAAAGYPPPREIIWSGGPVETARRWSSAVKAGRNLKAAIIERVRRNVEAKIREHVSVDMLSHLVTAGRMPAADAVGTNVGRVVTRAANEERPGLLTQLRRGISASMNLALDSWLAFDQSGAGQHELEWLGSHIFLREMFHLKDETASLVGLFQIATSAGWIVPHERVCWLSERHDVLKHDERGRLHCADGPALHYPDGWCAYAWKGVTVPPALIEEPETITVKAINKESDIHVRRCMIELLTPASYIAASGAVKVGRDDCGTLWRTRWPGGDVWTAVEVVNGTPETNGDSKHYYLQVPSTCRTPREAVAWTYGMSEEQYTRLRLRT